MASRTALILLLLLLPSAPPVTELAEGESSELVAPAIDGAEGPAWEGVRFIGGDEARVAAAKSVVERFAEAGLELPTVSVEFHETTEPCNGYDGFVRYEAPAPVITICSDRPYVLPHELAHAWIDENLTAEAKADYVEHWGLASWNDKSDEWNDRGTEHAAFAIQQNLTAAPPRMTRTWTERAEAYQMLTGLASPLWSTVG